MMRSSWFGVELRHLAALAAVAEEGSFRGAADALGYVQSAVSSQVAHLEQVLEVRLVERQRGPGTIRLTDAGTVVLAHANDILARFEAARADLELVKDGRTGRLRLGVAEALGASLLPGLVARFRRGAPALTLEVVEVLSDEELWPLVESGQVDAALGGLPQFGAFESATVLDDPYVLLAACGSPAARSAATITVDRLSRLPLIDHRQMEHVEAQLGPAGFVPRYVLRAEQYATARALVAEGVGAAIMPSLAVDADDPATRCIPLDDLLAPRTIAISWNGKRQASPGIEALIDAACGVQAARSGAVASLQLAS